MPMVNRSKAPCGSRGTVTLTVTSWVSIGLPRLAARGPSSSRTVGLRRGHATVPRRDARVMRTASGRSRAVPTTMTTERFTGFRREAIQFLADLAANNERAWVQPRKAEYQRLLKDPPA